MTITFILFKKLVKPSKTNEKITTTKQNFKLLKQTCVFIIHAVSKTQNKTNIRGSNKVWNNSVHVIKKVMMNLCMIAWTSQVCFLHLLHAGNTATNAHK